MKPSEETLGYLINDVARLIRREFHKRIESSHFTQAQARALVYVSRNEGIRQVELAELLEIQPITLARMIDQLEEHGLVERRQSPVDRRAYQLYLTPAAAPHLESIRAIGAALRADLLQGVSEQHAALVQEVLRKMRINLTSL